MFEIIRRREFIVDEKDVTMVIGVINNEITFLDKIVLDYSVGKFDEDDMDDNRWFIRFTSMKGRYQEIVKYLAKMGKLTIEDDAFVYFRRIAY